MTDERDPGRTFAPEDIGWIDFETKNALEDIKAGTYRYATTADAIVCAYAIGNGPAQAVAAFPGPLSWDDMPEEFYVHHERVRRGEAVWCAWNAGFDKAVWNYATADFPYLEPRQMIDAMAQATISGLPPSLKMAAKYCGATAKVEAGRDYIRQFCLRTSTATPESHPQDWVDFIDYAKGDIVTMREVFERTRQLPLAEWKEYWAMEKVNERGVCIDTYLVKHAAWLANEDKRRSAGVLAELTGGAVKGVDEISKISKWALERLPPEGRDILLRREEELDEEGNVVTPAKYSLTRPKIERLLAYLDTQPGIMGANLPLQRVLQIRLYGGGKSQAKFQKMWAQHVDGVLFGQYVFSGAPQTGRASSKGVQIHNLTRSFLPYEHQAIELLLANCKHEHLEALGDNSPVARKLALLVRPSFIPRPGNDFVWSDWRNIEARIVCWLCDHIQGAADRVQLFRDIDADPSLPDVYTRTTADIMGCSIADVTKPLRQRGKVAELALGFLGGVNSLLSMGASLGLHFTEDEARTIVTRWRDANSWAMQFGAELWDAMLLARSAPGVFIAAGRCGFIFMPEFLGGSMLMRLPSGRFLTYRALRYEDVPDYDKNDVVIGHSTQLTYGRNHGRSKLWKGELLNNATQGTAADLLRGTLRRLVDAGQDVVAHTHDEIILEADTRYSGTTAAELQHFMRLGFDWSDGLPIVTDETIAPYYTKWEAK